MTGAAEAEDRRADPSFPEEPGFTVAAQEPGEGNLGATASFPYDRMTVERFRSAFPAARWRDDLRAWFVPGIRAEGRLNRWLGREMAGVLAYADDRGRDAFAFDPVKSPYLIPDDDLRVRTPYSRTIVEEMRAVPWAWWDGDLKVWRVPFRSWEELRRRWPTIEAAAQRNEPAERQKRKDAKRGTPEQAAAAARASERRRHRYPVPDTALPSLGCVVMTHLGAVVFTEINGELAEDDVVRTFYPAMAAPKQTLVWAAWRKPTHEELVKTWPAQQAPQGQELAQGWWQATIDVLRIERRQAASRQLALKRYAGPPKED